LSRLSVQSKGLRTGCVVGALMTACAASGRASHEDSAQDLQSCDRLKSQSGFQTESVPDGGFRVREVDPQETGLLVGSCYLEAKQYRLAHAQFEAILRQRTASPYRCRAIHELLTLGQILGEEETSAVATLLDSIYDAWLAECPPDTLERVNYLLGVFDERHGKRKEAQDFLSSLPPSSSHYARARLLLALTFLQEQPERAKKILAEILALDPRSGQYDLANVQRLSREALDKAR
jgi:tetratricopeptide (TPR) repeat protein